MAAEPLPVQGGTLHLKRSDTRVWSDVIQENVGTDEAPVWQPYNLTGWTFACRISPDLNRKAVPIDLDTVVTDAANGVISRTLTASQSALLGADQSLAYMDLRGTRTSDGFMRTFKSWLVRVKGDVDVPDA